MTIFKAQNMTRAEAIRRCYDTDESNGIKLDSGEIIRSWVVVDNEGTVYDHRNMDDDELIELYKTQQNWKAAEYEEVG